MDLLNVMNRFSHHEEIISFEKYGNGHINVTYLAVSKDYNFYIVQNENNFRFGLLLPLMKS